MLKEFLAIIVATFLWGSSFPIIKIVVCGIDSFSYVWIRSLIAIAFLTPYIVYRAICCGIHRDSIYGGLVTGFAYLFGLWLQGWGTMYTSATNSAFITGLNTVFVHIYIAIARRSYRSTLAIELLTAVTGLYLLTNPGRTINIGDILVLLGAIAWAIQIVLVSRYGGREPVVFTYFELFPSLIFSIYSTINGLPPITVTLLLGLFYLGIACSGIAFALQAYGQKYISPEIASLVYLLEPVFASILSWIFLGETMSFTQIVGAMLIAISIAVAGIDMARMERGTRYSML
ncbi:protein of unknown function DUF6 transmembrane [Ignisphaera aggregans DSM 17230]|uniref:EamA domain-containing protein n=1 Tax=Ignisphaera aggregans (strain DSM 17230 / JCM 13409 / AQ1.S1) TaxID=583356 RepID=E0SSD1_IGNAA|nr:protein of unknown function DUF6 transmembrane [Ignisphaera aggregans DSM 17230]